MRWIGRTVSNEDREEDLELYVDGESKPDEDAGRKG
jgi:hypothetical protein